jgi:hypothetical protein
MSGRYVKNAAPASTDWLDKQVLGPNDSPALLIEVMIMDPDGSEGDAQATFKVSPQVAMRDMTPEQLHRLRDFPPFFGFTDAGGLRVGLRGSVIADEHPVLQACGSEHSPPGAELTLFVRIGTGAPSEDDRYACEIQLGGLEADLTIEQRARLGSLKPFSMAQEAHDIWVITRLDAADRGDGLETGVTSGGAS